MLGISSYILNEVSAMPTSHSWAAAIMAMPPSQMDEMTEKVDVWIMRTVMEKYPESDLAERIVRLMWPAVMEKEAIAAYLEEHPELSMALPVVSPEEAAKVGAMEVMADEADEKVAAEFLQQMLAGKLVPQPLQS